MSASYTRCEKRQLEKIPGSISSSQSSSELWSKVNALCCKRRSTPLTHNHQNSTITDPDKVADVLGGYFESLASIDKYEPDFKRRIQPSRMSIRNLVIPTDVRNLQINEAFSFSELLHSLSCSNGRSAGPDGIGYPLLKYLPASGKSKLLELFNKIWTEDYYPHE